MKERCVLVPYSSEEDRRKLEEYINERTGKRVDLGPIGYGGKLTLQIFYENDISHYERSNITCIRYFPGKRFRNADEFIDWHKKCSHDSVK